MVAAAFFFHCVCVCMCVSQCVLCVYNYVTALLHLCFSNQRITLQIVVKSVIMLFVGLPRTVVTLALGKTKPFLP